MIEIYCKLIISKRRTLDTIPDDFKSEVEARLKALGYDTNGDPITQED
jgi:hypothetical protein